MPNPRVWVKSFLFHTLLPSFATQRGGGGYLFLGSNLLPFAYLFLGTNSKRRRRQRRRRLKQAGIEVIEVIDM
jgi:hypothetical protein